MKTSATTLRAGILAASLVAFTTPLYAQGAGGAGGAGGGADLPQTSGQPQTPEALGQPSQVDPNTGSMSAPRAGKLCPPGHPDAGEAKC